MRHARMSLAVRGIVGIVGTAAWLTCTGCNSSSGGSGVVSDAGHVGDGGGLDAGAADATPGGVSFDPGQIGGLVGGRPDGGPADGGLGGGPISQQVVDGCNSLCAKEAAANCAKQGTVGDCVVGCRLILNNPSCSSAANALFACEKTSPAACDGQGKATLTGCAVEQLIAASCFFQNATDPTLKGPCASYCSAVAAAQCPNDDRTGCPTTCPVVGNFIPACNGYWKAYVGCASTATLTCGADGKANAPGCGLQGLAYILCTASGVANTPDAGQ